MASSLCPYSNPDFFGPICHRWRPLQDLVYSGPIHQSGGIPDCGQCPKQGKRRSWSSGTIGRPIRFIRAIELKYADDQWKDFGELFEAKNTAQ